MHKAPGAAAQMGGGFRGVGTDRSVRPFIPRRLARTFDVQCRQGWTPPLPRLPLVNEMLHVIVSRVCSTHLRPSLHRGSQVVGCSFSRQSE